MGDQIDQIPEGRRLVCDECGQVVEHMDMGVALQIMNNHMTRKHPNGEALKVGRTNR